MQQVHLADQLYHQAGQRARAAGFASVDEYVADELGSDLRDDAENFDHLFTRDRIAQLDQISAEANHGGQDLTASELREHFRKKSETWPKDSPG